MRITIGGSDKSTASRSVRCSTIAIFDAREHVGQIVKEDEDDLVVAVLKDCRLDNSLELWDLAGSYHILGVVRGEDLDLLGAHIAVKGAFKGEV